ncbi:MAG: SgcJ/EcaC family oxidoreductase [Rhizomicrobium sp.]
MKAPFLAAALLLMPAAASAGGEQNLFTHFMAAWDAADARALSALFAPDADFVSPSGAAAKGRDNIESFYAAAFARGYAGSSGEGEIVSARPLTPDLMLIDARFAISGARQTDGQLRPVEKGIMVAVLRKSAAGWRIAALRENEGAAGFSAFPPK